MTAESLGQYKRKLRSHVLITTEATYPYAVGGVSSWCDALIGGLRGIEWDILPIVAGGKRLRRNYELPPNARLLHPIELWSEDPPPRRIPRRDAGLHASLPTQLVRGLMPWRGRPEPLKRGLIARVPPFNVEDAE